MSLCVIGAICEKPPYDEFVDFTIIDMVEIRWVDVGYWVDWGMCFIVVLSVAGGFVSPVEEAVSVREMEGYP